MTDANRVVNRLTLTHAGTPCLVNGEVCLRWNANSRTAEKHRVKPEQFPETAPILVVLCEITFSLDRFPSPCADTGLQTRPFVRGFYV